ncbi:MAG: hypothetical protein GXY83_40760 [Rhodopirellula sp.]|nr:hypothetical protein [Rhodopirellula sp.]
MAAVSLFDEEVSDACGGEPDGTKHSLELFIADGYVHVSVDLSGKERSADLRLTKDQAIAFADAAESALFRLGIRE